MKQLFYLKKITAVLCTILFLCPILAVFGADLPVPPITAGISIDSTTAIPIITPESDSFHVPVRMTGAGGVLRNIQATIQDTSKLPFNFESISPSSTLSGLSENQGSSFSYYISVPVTAKPGRYPINLAVTYEVVSYVWKEVAPASNGVPPLYVSEEKVTAGTATLSAMVDVQNDQYDTLITGNPFDIVGSTVPDLVVSGDKFTVSILLENNLPIDLKNVTVALTVPTGLYFNDDTNKKTIEIGSSRNQEILFNMIAGEGMVAGKNQLTATITYKNVEDKDFVKEYLIIVNTPAAEEKKPAVLSIQSLTLPEKANAGESFKTVVTIKNTSKTDAQAVKVVLENDKNLQNTTPPELFIQELKAGESATKEVTYRVPDDAVTAYCAIKATVRYTSKGQKEELTQTISNGILLAEKPKADLSISKMGIVAKTKIETPFQLAVVISNTGGEAKNLTLTIEPAAGMACQSSSIIQIASIGANQTITKNIQLIASKEAKNEYNLIKLTLQQGDKIITTQYTGTIVDNPELKKPEENPDMPVIIIDKYDFGGKTVFGSQTFTLTLDFLNTSKTTAVKDMKITISSVIEEGSGGVFTPTSSSNTFFVENLAPKQSITKTIDLFVKSDAAPKSYGLSVDIAYKNPSGKDGTAKETITIPVQQETRFNVAEISQIPDVTMSEEALLSLSFGNLGKSIIYNVIVKIEGEGFTSAEKEFFAGNIESGKHVTKEFYLQPLAPGAISGKVTYSYENASGVVSSEERTFTFNAIEANQNGSNTMGDMENADMPVDVPPEGEGTGFLGMPNWVWYLVGGGVLVVGIVVVVIVIRAVKRKRRLEEDEGD